MSAPAPGLFGPGIFGTSIDLSALDPDTAYRLGMFVGEQIRDAELAGYTRAVRTLLTMPHSLEEHRHLHGFVDYLEARKGDV